jgi:hypothetical protein
MLKFSLTAFSGEADNSFRIFTLIIRSNLIKIMRTRNPRIARAYRQEKASIYHALPIA